MPKAYLVLQNNMVMNKIVSEDPEAMTSIKLAYDDDSFTIKEFEDPNDPEFVNSNNTLKSEPKEATNA